MGWDQLATVAQLVTGVGTLGVAVLLVSQLRQQHRDSERELLYTSNDQLQAVMQRTLDPHFGSIWHKGGEDFDSLNSEQQLQFRMFCQMAFVTQSVNFRSGHEGLDRGVDSRIKAQSVGAWRQWPGMGIYYERYGRSHSYDPGLRVILDDAFREVFGREVDTSWHFGMKQTAS
tara:strand:+ start:266 stop:784 length:519 start_codon:yes stop_codon:yes gene_type:complete